MKFGVFSVCAPEYDIEETVRLLSDLGYDGVEWRVDAVPAEAPKDVPHAARYWSGNRSTLDIKTLTAEAPAVRALCERNGIEIFGLSSYLKPREAEAIENVLKAAQIMGCGMVRVFPPGYGDSEDQRDYSLLFDETARHLEVLENLARRYGVKIVLEIHTDSLIPSPSSSYRLLSPFDPRYIGVILDPGNMVFEGFETYQKSFEILKDYIAHAHVKNGIWARDGEDEFGAAKWKREWTSIWKGMADLPHLFQVMKAKGYNGAVSVEDFSEEEDTLTKLRNNLAFMKKII